MKTIGGDNAPQDSFNMFLFLDASPLRPLRYSVVRQAEALLSDHRANNARIDEDARFTQNTKNV